MGIASSSCTTTASACAPPPTRPITRSPALPAPHAGTERVHLARVLEPGNVRGPAVRRGIVAPPLHQVGAVEPRRVHPHPDLARTRRRRRDRADRDDLGSRPRPRRSLLSCMENMAPRFALVRLSRFNYGPCQASESCSRSRCSPRGLQRQHRHPRRSPRSRSRPSPATSSSPWTSPARRAIRGSSSPRRAAGSASSRTARCSAQPFLDLSGRVSTGSEQGLLGLAFDPELRHQRPLRRQLHRPGRRHPHRRLPGLRRPRRRRPGQRGADPRRGPAVRQPQRRAGSPSAPTAILYIGLGDGGSGGDPQENGQSLTTLLGKLLRIDIDDGDALRHPAGQPVRRASAAARSEIWSYGLRNPWRFSFDRAQRRSLHRRRGPERARGDRREPRGGRRRSRRQLRLGRDGRPTSASSRRADATRPGSMLPAVQYDHGDGCSVTGGYVYRGSAMPVAPGHLLLFRLLRRVGPELPLRQRSRSPRSASGPRSQAGSVTSFGQDGAGELYILTAGWNRVSHRGGNMIRVLMLAGMAAGGRAR